MPRPKRPGAPEPKRRSRKGCWPCKARKVKCGEEKPSCLNCQRQGDVCDYSIRLNWEGRTKRNPAAESPGSQSSNSHLGGVLSSSDMLLDSTRVGPMGINLQDGASSSGRLLWDTASPESLPRNSPYSPELQGFGNTRVAAPAQAQDQLWSDYKDPPAAVNPPSLQHPAGLWSSTLAPNDVALQYQHSSVQPSLDGIPYPSPADTSSSMSPASALNLGVQQVPLPFSNLRRPLDTPTHSSDSPPSEPDGVLTQRPKRLKLQRLPSLSMDTGFPAQAEVHTENITSFGAGSYQPSSAHLSASPQQDAPSPCANATFPQESFLSKVVNGSFSPGSHSLRHSSDGLAHTLQVQRPEGPNQVTEPSTAESKWHTYLTTVTDNYGLDCGRPDLDLNRNNDHAAIDVNYALDLISPMWKNASIPRSADNPNGLEEQNPDNSSYAYYTSPVPINIPRYLSPLPSSLLKNPINLMYFHHFLNHTAKMLVPHDCGDNPFISVMPSMAIGDPNLLNLMLAYSASHRARYLEHPEPANRIAHWVSNVFPALRLALDGPHEDITDSHLATAIMLLSLKIISPSTFEVPIPWQSHLKLARDLFLAREKQLGRSGNYVGAFLARWLGYLDILGILSCRHNEPPLSNTAYNYVVSVCSATGGFDETCIDCFSGFTARTGIFLTRLGQLTHRCDNERFDETGSFLADWRPSSDTLLKAQDLLCEFGDLHEHSHVNDTHYRSSEAREILAINQSFRCAGLLHLHRRVLGSPSTSPPVIEALKELINALNQIKTGSSAEVGVLFPLFTAGCEIQDPQSRFEIMQRIMDLERTGMKQIQSARVLMQRCWDEGLPWIALAQGEFLG